MPEPGMGANNDHGVGGSDRGTDRPDDNDRGGSREAKESFDRAMDNTERPDRAPAAPSDANDSPAATDKPDDRQDRAAGPPGIGAPPSSSPPADTDKKTGDDNQRDDRAADKLTAPPTDAEGDARSTSPVAGRIDNTVNYSFGDLRNVLTDEPGLTPEQCKALADGAAVMNGVAISDEYCTIEVRSKPVLHDNIPIGHAYVTTTDADGTNYFRGGPEVKDRPPRDNSKFGNIVTDYGAYAPGTKDYAIADRPTMHVASLPGSCDVVDAALAKSFQEIEDQHHDYHLLGPNSNTTVREGMERAGVDIPPAVDLPDHLGTLPGWDHDLPDEKQPDPDRRPDPWSQPMP